MSRSVQGDFKKAVVKKLQKYFPPTGQCTSARKGPEFKIEVSLLKDKARVLIDTTGPSLFKRGYRTEKVELLLKRTWQRLLSCLVTGSLISLC